MRFSLAFVALLSATHSLVSADEPVFESVGATHGSDDVTELHMMIPHELEALQERIVANTEDEKEQVLRTRSGITQDMLKHYGPPPTGCEPDETAFQINGIPGSVCSAKCTDFMPCPTDVPAGVTASPMCALQNGQTGDKYCVLICKPELEQSENIEAQLRGSISSTSSQCGDATCQPIQGLGICTYA